MQLTLYTDYSLRVLVYLGIRSEHVATITEIARSYGISRNHLVKVVHNLAHIGFVHTSRGRGGGMRLARRPRDINIGDVVRQTELNFNLVECFDVVNNTCPIAPICALKGALYEAQKQFMGVLDSYTLADVLGNKNDLAKFLKISADVGEVENS